MKTRLTPLFIVLVSGLLLSGCYTQLKVSEPSDRGAAYEDVQPRYGHDRAYGTGYYDGFRDAGFYFRDYDRYRWSSRFGYRYSPGAYHRTGTRFSFRFGFGSTFRYHDPWLHYDPFYYSYFNPWYDPFYYRSGFYRHRFAYRYGYFSRPHALMVYNLRYTDPQHRPVQTTRSATYGSRGSAVGSRSGSVDSRRGITRSGDSRVQSRTGTSTRGGIQSRSGSSSRTGNINTRSRSSSGSSDVGTRSRSGGSDARSDRSSRGSGSDVRSRSGGSSDSSGSSNRSRSSNNDQSLSDRGTADRDRGALAARSLVGNTAATDTRSSRSDDRDRSVFSRVVSGIQSAFSNTSSSRSSGVRSSGNDRSSSSVRSRGSSGSSSSSGVQGRSSSGSGSSSDVNSRSGSSSSSSDRDSSRSSNRGSDNEDD